MFESDNGTKPMCTAVCCEIISIGPSIESAALLESTPEKAELMRTMLKPINMVTAENDWQMYECTMFDKENRLCTVYDKRPDGCRFYPRESICPFCKQPSNKVMEEK